MWNRILRTHASSRNEFAVSKQDNRSHGHVPLQTWLGAAWPEWDAYRRPWVIVLKCNYIFVVVSTMSSSDFCPVELNANQSSPACVCVSAHETRHTWHGRTILLSQHKRIWLLNMRNDGVRLFYVASLVQATLVSFRTDNGALTCRMEMYVFSPGLRLVFHHFMPN